MADDNIGNLIPEIYYDLIARVASGVPVVIVILVSITGQENPLLDLRSLLLISGFGFVVGHLLGAVSLLLNFVIWRPWALAVATKVVKLKCDLPHGNVLEIFRGIYDRIDTIAAHDKSGGAILKKMEAGSALSDNLFSGWIVLWGLYWFGVPVGWALRFGEDGSYFRSLIVTLVLGFSMVARRVTFIARQDSIWASERYNASSPVKTGSNAK